MQSANMNFKKFPAHSMKHFKTSNENTFLVKEDMISIIVRLFTVIILIYDIPNVLRERERDMCMNIYIY